MAETRLHEVDEKLDEIEQIMALYEAKLGSVPEEYFEDIEFMPPVQDAELVVRTENPLLNIQKNTDLNPVLTAIVDEIKKDDAKAEVKQTQGFVPSPPENGPKIIAPTGMPPVKTYPIGGVMPAGMSFPGQAASAGAAAPSSAGGAAADQDAPAAGGAPEVDDGFTPEQRRKNELEIDAGFKKYLMMKRMKMGLAIIRKKIRDDDAGYKPSDIDLFADAEEIKEADFMLI